MLGNWIKQTSTTTGTGALTLSAVSGFPGFSSQFATNERFCYTIIDDATGGPIERGIGYLDGSGNLVRETPMATFISGVYTGANPSAANLSAGTKRVICSGGAQTDLTSAPGVWASNYKGYGDIHGSAAGGILALVADRAYALPFSAAVDSDIDAVLFSVTTAAAAGKLAVCALFSVGRDGLPGVKIAETSQVLVDSTGVKTATFGSRVRPPSRFFVALLSDGAPTFRAFNTTVNGVGFLGCDSVLIPNAFIHHVGATGLVFPTTWTPVGNLSGAARPYLVVRCAG